MLHVPPHYYMLLVITPWNLINPPGSRLIPASFTCTWNRIEPRKAKGKRNETGSREISKERGSSPAPPSPSLVKTQPTLWLISRGRVTGHASQLVRPASRSVSLMIEKSSLKSPPPLLLPGKRFFKFSKSFVLLRFSIFNSLTCKICKQNKIPFQRYLTSFTSRKKILFWHCLQYTFDVYLNERQASLISMENGHALSISSTIDQFLLHDFTIRPSIKFHGRRN